MTVTTQTARFEQRFKQTLEAMIDKDHDDYRELQFSKHLYVHVGSHPDGGGAFEISVIVPYTKDYDRDTETLSLIDGTEQLYQTLSECVEAATGNEYDLVFHLTEQVTDGVWAQDANVYDTFKLTT